MTATSGNAAGSADNGGRAPGGLLELRIRTRRGLAGENAGEAEDEDDASCDHGAGFSRTTSLRQTPRAVRSAMKTLAGVARAQ